MKVLMAKNYIDNLSEETRKGMDEKARRGIWPSYAPIGYRNVVDVTGKKGIEIDPDAGPKIAEIYRWYATGLYSLSEITRKARSSGITFRDSSSFIPRATIHKILRNVIYTGDFEWKGKRHQGSHTPLVNKDLWLQVQTVLATRHAHRSRRMKHEFAYSGLIQCGRCGCAFVGEIKKSKYVYYHCTGYRGNCGEKYTKEADLDACFSRILRCLRFDSEVLGWICDALIKDVEGERRARTASKGKLQEQINRLQFRIESMYVDKLDGKISHEFFENKKWEWEAEQRRLQKTLEDSEQSDPDLLFQGQRLLRVIARIPQLFEAQPPTEKRRLLNFVLSNSTWKDGKLSADFRQPFDLLMDASLSSHEYIATERSGSRGFEKWLPGLDSN
jgi:site-specific DNA recombinase